LGEIGWEDWGVENGGWDDGGEAQGTEGRRGWGQEQEGWEKGGLGNAGEEGRSGEIRGLLKWRVWYCWEFVRPAAHRP
jgi:hypothetical protein